MHEIRATRVPGFAAGIIDVIQAFSNYIFVHIGVFILYIHIKRTKARNITTCISDHFVIHINMQNFVTYCADW